MMMMAHLGHLDLCLLPERRRWLWNLGRRDPRSGGGVAAAGELRCGGGLPDPLQWVDVCALEEAPSRTLQASRRGWCRRKVEGSAWQGTGMAGELHYGRMSLTSAPPGPASTQRS